jgi:Glycosyl transferase family 90
LAIITKNISLPDVDFFLSTHDTILIPMPEGVAPIFTYAVNINYRKNLVLVPDSLILSKFGSIYHEILDLNKEISWESKINQAYWRGSSTGCIYDPKDYLNSYVSHVTKDNYQKFPRVILIEQALKYPTLIDAKFTNYVQMTQETKEMMINKYSIAHHVSKREQLKYKIQLTIDGNSATYLGFLWRLLSNSVNIKQDSGNIQWFYRLFKPMIHYVPVKNDLSDIIAQIEWINNHDSQAQQISNNASKLVQDKVNIKAIYFYLYVLLKEYSTKLDFKPDLDESYIKVI